MLARCCVGVGGAGPSDKTARLGGQGVDSYVTLGSPDMMLLSVGVREGRCGRSRAADRQIRTESRHSLTERQTDICRHDL